MSYNKLSFIASSFFTELSGLSNLSLITWSRHVGRDEKRGGKRREEKRIQTGTSRQPKSLLAIKALGIAY